MSLNDTIRQNLLLVERKCCCGRRSTRNNSAQPRHVVRWVGNYTIPGTHSRLSPVLVACAIINAASEWPASARAHYANHSGDIFLYRVVKWSAPHGHTQDLSQNLTKSVANVWARVDVTNRCIGVSYRPIGRYRCSINRK